MYHATRPNDVYKISTGFNLSTFREALCALAKIQENIAVTGPPPPPKKTLILVLTDIVMRPAPESFVSTGSNSSSLRGELDCSREVLKF